MICSELNKFQLVELDSQEIKTIDGGNPALYFAAFMAAVTVYDAMTEFAAGFREAQNIKNHSNCR